MASPSTANTISPPVLLGTPANHLEARKEESPKPVPMRAGSGASLASERSNRSTSSQRAARISAFVGRVRTSTMSWDMSGRRRESVVPWYVRRGCKTKAFALALIECIFVFGATVLADQHVDSSMISVAKPLMWMAGCAALFTVLFAIFARGFHVRVQYACLVIIVVTAAVFWTMADVAVFADWADVPAQVHGIMAMVCVTCLLAAQIPPTRCCTKPPADRITQTAAEEIKERAVFITGFLAGWFIGASLCVLVMFNRHSKDCDDMSRQECLSDFATNTRIASLATSSFMTFVAAISLAIASGPALLRCDPDDFMYAALTMTISLFSVIGVVFLAFGTGVTEGVITCRSARSEQASEAARASTIDTQVNEIVAACDGERTLRPPVESQQSKSGEQVEETTI